MSTPRRVAFFGTPDFAAAGLRALLADPRYQVVVTVTQPDRPAGRGKQETASPVKRLALEHRIPVVQPRRIRADVETFMSQVAAAGPLDIGVVIAFGQILPQQVLDLPGSGCVNVHASILPRWRGAAPIQRAIMAGDQTTGVALMRMEAGLDTGPVYSLATTAISVSDTFGSLHDRLAALGASLLARDLDAIVQGSLHATPQPEQGATYASKIEGAEANIQWNVDATSIVRHIHGLSPFPGAFTHLHGKRLKCYRAAVVTTNGSISAPPGTIISANSDGIVVQCGQGRVALLELQLEGRKRLPVQEFVKGVSLDCNVQLDAR